MTSEATDELRGFSADARRAVALADTEARQLGHDRVGTEHLLLGLLSVDGTVAAERLRDAGASLAAARHKVVEAVASSDPPSAGARPRTERAVRALGRAVRFSHASRSNAVGAEHVLLGVLDVEGTAGQVLRGLGVDVERLRAALRDNEDTGDPASESADEAGPPPPICPACVAVLDDAVTYRVLVARGPRGPREVVAYACGACGRLLGVAPTHPEPPSG